MSVDFGADDGPDVRAVESLTYDELVAGHRQTIHGLRRAMDTAAPEDAVEMLEARERAFRAERARRMLHRKQNDRDAAPDGVAAPCERYDYSVGEDAQDAIDDFGAFGDTRMFDPDGGNA